MIQALATMLITVITSQAIMICNSSNPKKTSSKFYPKKT